jgi:hypothetical protein
MITVSLPQFLFKPVHKFVFRELCQVVAAAVFTIVDTLLPWPALSVFDPLTMYVPLFFKNPFQIEHGKQGFRVRSKRNFAGCRASG